LAIQDTQVSCIARQKGANFGSKLPNIDWYALKRA